MGPRIDGYLRGRKAKARHSTTSGLWQCKCVPGCSRIWSRYSKLLIHLISLISLQAAHDKIPAHSTLHFDVECLKVEDGPNPINVFKEIDEDGDDKLSREEVGEFLKKQLSQAYQASGQNDIEDHGSMLEEVFKHEDKDNDGFITREEFSGPKYDHEEL